MSHYKTNRDHYFWLNWTFINKFRTHLSHYRILHLLFIVFFMIPCNVKIMVQWNKVVLVVHDIYIVGNKYTDTCICNINILITWDILNIRRRENHQNVEKRWRNGMLKSIIKNDNVSQQNFIFTTDYCTKETILRLEYEQCANKDH